eukprot:Awhi_evm1s7944
MYALENACNSLKFEIGEYWSIKDTEPSKLKSIFASDEYRKSHAKDICYAEDPKSHSVSLPILEAVSNSHECVCLEVKTSNKTLVKTVMGVPVTKNDQLVAVLVFLTTQIHKGFSFNTMKTLYNISEKAAVEEIPVKQDCSLTSEQKKLASTSYGDFVNLNAGLSRAQRREAL